jgi:hypothetical protein
MSGGKLERCQVWADVFHYDIDRSNAGFQDISLPYKLAVGIFNIFNHFLGMNWGLAERFQMTLCSLLEFLARNVADSTSAKPF